MLALRKCQAPEYIQTAKHKTNEHYSIYQGCTKAKASEPLEE